MSDPVLNEEIARLESEIDAVRDALDEAIKRNEGLEAALAAAMSTENVRVEREADYYEGWTRSRQMWKRRALQAEAALKTARKALETISDNGGDTLTIEDAVRMSSAALAIEPKP